MNAISRSRCTRLLLGLAAFVAAGCGADRSEEPEEQLPRLAPEELGALSEDRVRLTLPWGSGNIRNQGRQSDSAAVLTELTISPEGGFDRITMEFEGPSGVVGYEISPAPGPISACEDTPEEGPDGEHWLNVRFLRIRAAPELAQAIAGERAMDAVQEVRIACTQGERLGFAIRLEGPARHRVTEAADPSAIVIDIEH